MNKLQWHSFEKKIYIHSSVEKLYRLWASQDGITSWFLQRADFKDQNGTPRKANELVQNGDSYTWFWHNWDGKADGEITQANGKDFIEFSFEGSMVSVALEKKTKLWLLL